MRRGNNDQAERGTNVGQKQVCRGRSGKQIKKINIRKKPKVETADQVMSHLPRCFFFSFFNQTIAKDASETICK